MYILINNIPINVLSDIKRIHPVKEYKDYITNVADGTFVFSVELKFEIQRHPVFGYMSSYLFSKKYNTKEEAQEVLDSLLLFINGITSSLNKINI